jgi:hypothetical protein
MGALLLGMKPIHDHIGDVARYVGCSVVTTVERPILRLDRTLGFITIFLPIVVQSLA